MAQGTKVFHPNFLNAHKQLVRHKQNSSKRNITHFRSNKILPAKSFLPKNTKRQEKSIDGDTVTHKDFGASPDLTPKKQEHVRNFEIKVVMEPLKEDIFVQPSPNYIINELYTSMGQPTPTKEHVYEHACKPCPSEKLMEAQHIRH